MFAYGLQLAEPFLLSLLALLSIWRTLDNLDISTSQLTSPLTSPLHRFMTPIITSFRPGPLPDVLLVGASKCGSIPLANFLSLHPNISFSGNFLRFFNHDDTYFNKGLFWYDSQMSALNSSDHHRLVLDGNAAYFTDARVPKRVARSHPNVKILLILREPVQRILSDYAQAIVYKRRLDNITDPPDSFKKLFTDKAGDTNIVNNGVIWSVYVAHLRRWLQYFPRDNIHVVDGEAFLNHPVPELRRVEAFLGLPNFPYDSFLEPNYTSGYYCIRDPRTCFGHGKTWMRPYVDSETFASLSNFFKGYNQELFQIIGRTFPWKTSFQ